MDVCIATLNCYDLLQRCVDSILAGTVLPERILIVDNGGNMPEGMFSDNPSILVHTPPENMGVAATWNWFIANTIKVRAISNDDVIFAKNTLEQMTLAVQNGMGFVHGNNAIAGFSLFALTDDVINSVGLFDETISPKYGYYEDNDYSYRMDLLGIPRGDVVTDVFHTGSATLRRYSPTEETEHWRKYTIAKQNYIKKWGGEPTHETVGNIRG